MDLREGKELFMQQFGHLWLSPENPNGLHCVGIGAGCITVSAPAQDTLDLLPSDIAGVPILKSVRPIARPLGGQ